MEKELDFITEEVYTVAPVEDMLQGAQDAVIQGLRTEGASESVIEEFTRRGLDDVVEESVEKNLFSLEHVQQIFPKFFPDCKGWKDVFKESAKVSIEAHKEYFFIQVFAGGTILYFASTDPILKNLGPVLMRVGFQNSKLLQKMLTEEDLKRVIKK
ncbi:MAG: hypothetical protein RBT33_01030 [Candidatus Dojkabacteria bacterium]|jgi:hypothetical protein|nr:hypothetical protein [Candidatus Dojkabacteria bacterium]